MYPTLIEMAKLPQPKDKPGGERSLEGVSLVPQLKDAKATRLRPAITTHNHDNHGVRSEHWRYIRYADGSQELYDLRNDPEERKHVIGSKDRMVQAVIADLHRKLLAKMRESNDPVLRWTE